MNENIIAGLISGLFVSIFVLAFRQFWNSVIVPWFEERVYKDVHIEGKWFGLLPDTTDYKQFVIALQRHGHLITGKMICITGVDEGEEYRIDGSFRNLILPLNYECCDKNKTDRGSITLKSMHNGERLVGKIAFYDTNKDGIGTSNITWFRDKNDLNKTIETIKLHEDKINTLTKEERKISIEKEKLETIPEESGRPILIREDTEHAVESGEEKGDS